MSFRSNRLHREFSEWRDSSNRWRSLIQEVMFLPLSFGWIFRAQCQLYATALFVEFNNALKRHDEATAFNPELEIGDGDPDSSLTGIVWDLDGDDTPSRLVIRSLSVLLAAYPAMYFVIKTGDALWMEVIVYLNLVYAFSDPLLEFAP